MHSMSHTSLPITRYSINPAYARGPRTWPRERGVYTRAYRCRMAPDAEVSVLIVRRGFVSDFCIARPHRACLLTVRKRTE